MRNTLICLALVILAYVPAVSRAGIVEVPLEGVQRLVLKGWDANVNVVAQPQSKMIKINGVDDVLSPGLYIVERKGTTLEIHMNEWSSKTDWKNHVSQKKNRKTIEINGPSLPIEIFLKEGQVQLSRWGKEAKVTVLQGKVTSQEGHGPLEINVQQGDVTVPSQNGKLRIDQYQGHTTVKNLNGDLDLFSFGSTVNVEKAKGALSLNTQNAPVKVIGSSGSLQLENGRGVISVQQFQGRIDGSTQEGPLSIQVLPESEVYLKAQTGRIQVQLPSGSGAGLNLVSNEGDIFLPDGLKVGRTATEKIFKGRMRGENQKASVVVRSVEGSIIIK